MNNKTNTQLFAVDRFAAASAATFRWRAGSTPATGKAGVVAGIHATYAMWHRPQPSFRPGVNV